MAIGWARIRQARRTFAATIPGGASERLAGGMGAVHCSRFSTRFGADAVADARAAERTSHDRHPRPPPTLREAPC